MRFPPSPSDLFAISFVALPVLGYAIVALTRKPRFRALASKLGAAYTDTGWFAPGKITGDRFVIEAYTRSLGRHSTYRTSVRVAARGTPGRFLVKPGFFKVFPNWEFAKILELRPERAFVTEISVPRYVEPTREQREIFLQWLARASVNPALLHEALTTARIREIVIEDGSIVTGFSGFVSNFARLQRTVDVLLRLAGEVPAGPTLR